MKSDKKPKVEEKKKRSKSIVHKKMG
jgi:hypothetical protein